MVAHVHGATRVPVKVACTSRAPIPKSTLAAHLPVSSRSTRRSAAARTGRRVPHLGLAALEAERVEPQRGDAVADVLVHEVEARVADRRQRAPDDRRRRRARSGSPRWGHPGAIDELSECRAQVGAVARAHRLIERGQHVVAVRRRRTRDRRRTDARPPLESGAVTRPSPSSAPSAPARRPRRCDDRHGDLGRAAIKRVAQLLERMRRRRRAGRVRRSDLQAC